MTLTCGSLFSGIGLLDYGLHLAGFDHRWFVERDEFRRSILSIRWPGVPVHDDVRAVGAADLERVDLLVGGFPCKGVSNAGRQAGFGHPETALWREQLRLVRELRPRYVLVENVAALLRLHDGALFSEVIAGLAASGYMGEWDCFPAAAFGAPHGRDRVFITAIADPEDGAEPHVEGGAAGGAARRPVVGTVAGAGGRAGGGHPAARAAVGGRAAGPVEEAAADAGDARPSRAGRDAQREGAQLARDDARKEAPAAADPGGAGREELDGTAVAVGPEVAGAGERGDVAAADAVRGGQLKGRGHASGREPDAAGRGEEAAADAGSVGRGARGGLRPGEPGGVGRRRPADDVGEGRAAAAAADPVGRGVGADGRVHRGDAGGGDRPVGAPVPARPEVALAADAEPDRAGAAADTAGGGRRGWPADPGPGDARDGATAIGGEGIEAAGDGGRPAPADADRLGRARVEAGDSPDGRVEVEPGHDADGRSPDFDWGGYEPAIRRWEVLLGRPAPVPLVRRVDDGRPVRVDRSRLSALGDGVLVQAGWLCGVRIIDYEERVHGDQR